MPSLTQTDTFTKDSLNRWTKWWWKHWHLHGLLTSKQPQTRREAWNSEFLLSLKPVENGATGIVLNQQPSTAAYLTKVLRTVWIGCSPGFAHWCSVTSSNIILLFRVSREEGQEVFKVESRSNLCGAIHQRCCDAYSRRPNYYQTVHAALNVVSLQDSRRQRQHGHPGTAEDQTWDPVCCGRFSGPRRRARSDGQPKFPVLRTSLPLEMQQNSTCGFQGEQDVFFAFWMWHVNVQVV